MITFGIMQGRLSDKNGAPLQSFPIEAWKVEFFRAKRVGFDNIEWLVDGVSDEHNPIFSPSGRRQIREQIIKSGIRVESLCAHTLIDGDLIKTRRARATRIDYMKRLIESSADIGIKRIIIPAMGTSGLENEDASESMVDMLMSVAPGSDNLFLLETDLSHWKIIHFIAKLDLSNIGVVLDIGNVNALGFDFSQEIKALGGIIREVHIKDRRRVDGKSVRLGRGGSPFGLVSNELAKIHWSGCFVLETPVFDNWLEESCHNLKFSREIFKMSR